MGLLRRLYNVARSNVAALRKPGEAFIPEEPITPETPNEGDPGVVESAAAAYYANLELAPGASYAEIKSAYRRLLRKYHPDKHLNNASKARTAEEIAKRLNEAMDYFEQEHEGGRL